ncbi:hypothetical protein [Chitinophaga sp. CF418]|uniref:hypothetical protein n=1 Tax=Chitinophaga sp. CF418 TaxID=1855287 RepID=UPI0009173023|nr:hypothetical protein [Chitinophaga sp. CF418]SHN44326.1 hypothetical protein SAMN05216311_11744 [Chitinophaga sp. CF418]
MSENQFEVIMAAIQSLKSDMNARLNGVEAELVSINGELKKIERWTHYNANLDVMAKLAGVNVH